MKSEANFLLSNLDLWRGGFSSAYGTAQAKRKSYKRKDHGGHNRNELVIQSSESLQNWLKNVVNMPY